MTIHQKSRFYFFLALLIMPIHPEAAPECEHWAAKVVSIQGQVDRQHSDNTEWQAAHKDDLVCPGDKVRTSKWSRSTLVLNNESIVTLDQNTTLSFPEEAEPTPENTSAQWFLNLIQGATFFRSRETHRLNIQTPFINAVHEGTEFLVAVDDNQAVISVFDGRVSGQNRRGKVQINKGFAGIAPKNLPPTLRTLTVAPEDAVQWSLYYPPIIDDQALKSRLPAAYSSAVAANYAQGNLHQALATLDSIPPSQQDASFLTVKAALLLTVGRVDEAQPHINQALQIEPGNSDAHALQAIIAVAKNKQQSALELAQKATALNPKSSVAQVALSYARQALFNIDEALIAARKAVQLAPDNALVWARLSELQLSTGERNSALSSAQKAQTLNPNLTRTQTVLGFAALAQIDINAAKTAFEQAIVLDSSDPLARLGLGLAKIRKGQLEEGKKELEIAVNLDPNNAVVRSYLGKAYYELRNKDYAGAEFNIAKDMDPKDPTPWFYDAILKQTTNRPVEALRDMQQAIELNDNRKVYRSKLLLDEDAAARTANLARIYTDLGFGRVALKEAWKSLGYDSTSASAHRFLSDAYVGQPRYRVARASELLQAQLLQPINITPVQPQLTAENIGILNTTGPANLSTNEYDPLYTSNGAHIVLNGAYGSNNTLTDNAIISGVYDKLSMSLGQFHFQTDGFRQNDDYKQDIYDAFAQVAISPNLNIQVEFKSDDVRSGDVPLRLNGFHQENLRQTIEHDTARIGGHYKISPEQDLIASFFYTTRKDSVTNRVPVPGFPGLVSNKFASILDTGHQSELQYIFHLQPLEIIAGMGYLNQNSDVFNKEIDEFIDPPPPELITESLTMPSTQLETDYFNAYIYLKHQIYPNLLTTLGLGFDSFNSDVISRQQLNPNCDPFFTNCEKFVSEPLDRVQLDPKFGLIWSPITDLTLRGAAFRTFNRPLAANQTIEPSQIAGFNQFFDGNNGATAWQYAFGLDYKPVSSFFTGGEIIWRNATQPFIDLNTATQQSTTKLRNRNEISHLAYLYWVPTEWTSFRSEYRYDKISRDFEAGKTDDTNPRSIATHQVPISLNLFHPNGLFATIAGTYVNQHVASVKSTAGLDYQSEDFWTVDASLGFRFPKKLGAVSFEVKNLFDNEFNYQSVFDASGPQLTPFVPERQLFAKLSLFY